MHSWRVLILPFLEQRELYDAYNFAEPWDGPNNRKLADRDRADLPPLRPGVGSGSHDEFRGGGRPRDRLARRRRPDHEDLGDGSHETLMVVEVPDGQFRWMEPRDLQFERMSFRINDGSGRGLGSRLGGARVVFADGMVRTLPDDFDPKTLRAMLTANGGEAIHE